MCAGEGFAPFCHFPDKDEMRSESTAERLRCHLACMLVTATPQIFGFAYGGTSLSTPGP